MEQTLRTITARPRNFGVLRGWLDWFWTQRRKSRELRHLVNLPDHLLRDIGREDLIVPRPKPGPYGP